MKDQLAKGVVWLSSAKAIINLLAFLSTILLARLLTPEDFGLVALATTLLAIIAAVTELSLSSALIHHKNPTEYHYHSAWTLNVIRALLVSLLFCAAAPFVAKFYNEPRLLNIMLVISITVLMSGFKNPKMVMLTRNLVFWQDFVLTVSQKMAGFIVGVTIAFIYKSYWALVGGMVATQIVNIVVSYIIVPYRPRFAIKHARELWSFSMWLTFGQIVNTLNWKLDHLLVGTYISRTALGYYSVGDNLAGMPTREAIGPLETTLFPGFAKIVDDKERLRSAYRSAQTLVSAIALPVGIGCALIAHPLVLLAMGEKWLPAVQVIQVLSCVFALQTLSSPVHPLAMAKGETKLLFQRDLFSFCMRVPIIITGMYFGGLMGIVYARAVTGIIAMYINMHLVRRLIGTAVSSQLVSNTRSVVSVLIMAAGVVSLEYYLGRDGVTVMLVLKIVEFVLLGAVLYIVSHLLLWLSVGKPAGPERELIKIAFKVVDKIKHKVSL